MKRRKKPKATNPDKWTPNRRADFIVENHGNVFLVQPCNERATRWLNEHCNTAPYLYLGKNLCVEHRYIAEIVHGMMADGLIVI